MAETAKARELIVDLHVHNHYSRATSKDCTLSGLYYWAKVKGIHVIGTGDFTHPVWFKELRDQLVFDKTAGLYRLRPELAGPIDKRLPPSVAGQPLWFVPTVEISTIYSKGLEFPNVFIAGCNQGQLPSSRAEEPEALAEELRLFYVAVTRARDTLTLMHTRRWVGKTVGPSAFLDLLALPTELDNALAATEQRRQRSRQKRSQQSLF